MPDSDSLIGQTLSHYQIVEKIGAGGMGVVYRAHDNQLNRDAALKVLPVGALNDEAARKLFRKDLHGTLLANLQKIGLLTERMRPRLESVGIRVPSMV